MPNFAVFLRYIRVSDSERMYANFNYIRFINEGTIIKNDLRINKFYC